MEKGKALEQGLAEPSDQRRLVLEDIDEWWERCTFNNEINDCVEISEQINYGLPNEYWIVKTPYGSIKFDVSKSSAIIWNQHNIDDSQNPKKLDEIDGWMCEYEKKRMKEWVRKKVKEKGRKKKMRKLKKEHPHFYKIINFFKRG